MIKKKEKHNMHFYLSSTPLTPFAESGNNETQLEFGFSMQIFVFIASYFYSKFTS